MKIHEESNVEELLEVLSELKASEIEIGILGDGKGSTYLDSGATTLQIANIHEFGAPDAGIPSRSFIRAGFDKNKSDIIKQGEDLLTDVIALNLEPGPMMEAIGEASVGKIQEFLTELKKPPLKPITIKLKGSSNPLIDTGQLRDSITHKVRK